MSDMTSSEYTNAVDLFFRKTITILCLSVALFLTSLLYLETAHADSSDLSRAGSLQVEAIELSKNGLYLEALQKIDRAQEIFSDLKNLYIRARIKEKMGAECGSLIAAWETFSKQCINCPLMKKAESSIEKINRRCIVTLKVSGAPQDATLKIDQSYQSLLPQDELKVLTGTHHVEVSKIGYETFSQTIQLDALKERTARIEYRLQPVTATAVSLGGPARHPGDEPTQEVVGISPSQDSNLLSPISYVGAAIFIGVGAYFLNKSFNYLDTLDKRNGMDLTPSEHSILRDDITHNHTSGMTLIGVGAGVALGGAIYALTRSPHPPTSTRSTSADLQSNQSSIEFRPYWSPQGGLMTRLKFDF